MLKSAYWAELRQIWKSRTISIIWVHYIWSTAVHSDMKGLSTTTLVERNDYHHWLILIYQIGILWCGANIHNQGTLMRKHKQIMENNLLRRIPYQPVDAKDKTDNVLKLWLWVVQPTSIWSWFVKSWRARVSRIETYLSEASGLLIRSNIFDLLHMSAESSLWI